MGGVFAKNTSRETKKIPSQKAEEIYSQDWYFSQIPLHNMIYLFNYTKYYLEHWLNKLYLLFVVSMNILFLLFVTWQLLNTIGRFELFPSAGTVVVFRFVLLDSG